jgi:hypothetical protein
MNTAMKNADRMARQMRDAYRAGEKPSAGLVWEPEDLHPLTR